MALRHDAVVLFAFGGPRTAAEVPAFVERAAAGRPIPKQRLEEVVRHYQLIGGASPLSRLTFEQARALEQFLADRGQWLPVYVGMRSWYPFIGETLANMAEEGIKQACGIVLAPQRTVASYQRYVEEVERMTADKKQRLALIEFAPPWHDHPLFVTAVAESVEEKLGLLSSAARAKTHLLFTAHSVPLEMVEASGYQQQVREGSSLVADRLGHSRWSVAYQSRSGPPQEQWLEPDVEVALHTLKGQGVSSVVVVPIGFVCDHVEVLFDLDLQARQAAEREGIEFMRAPALNDRPAFIEMLAQVVKGGSSS